MGDGARDCDHLAVEHTAHPCMPDLRLTGVTRLPTTLDRDIDTLLSCSGPAPLARPSGRDLGEARINP